MILDILLALFLPFARRTLSVEALKCTIENVAQVLDADNRIDRLLMGEFHDFDFY